MTAKVVNLLRAHRRGLSTVALVTLLVAAGIARGDSAGAADGDVTITAGVSTPQCDDDLNAVVTGDQAGPAASTAISPSTTGIAVDANGTVLYLAGGSSQRILRVNLATGNLDTVARGLIPRGIAVDPRNSSVVYILNEASLSGQSVIQLLRLDVSTPTSTPTVTVGDLGLGTSLGDRRYAVAVDAAGNVYASEPGGSGRVVKASPSGTVATVASGLGAPYGLAVEPVTGTLFIADAGRHGAKDGRLLTAVGGGTPTIIAQNLSFPRAVALNPSDLRLFVAQNDAFKVTEHDIKGNYLQDVAGSGIQGAADGPGKGTLAQLDNPTSLAVDKNNNVFVLDADTCIVRKVQRMPAWVDPKSTTTAAQVTTTAPVTTTPTPTTPIPTTPVQQPNVDPRPQVQPVPKLEAPTAPDPVPTPGPGQAAPTPTPDPGSSSFVPSPLTQSQGGGFFPGEVARSNFFGADPTPIAGGTPVQPTPVQPGAFGPQLGPAVPAAVPAPAPPPVAPASPPPAGSAFVPAANPAATPNPAVVGPEGEALKGAPRYAMIAKDSATPSGPIEVAAGVGVVSAFGCILALAADAEKRRARRRSPAARPRRAY